MCEELIRLLLGQINTLSLSYLEKARYRTHVMYLWSVYLLPPTTSGLINFNYHLKTVITYDRVAVVFFPFAMLGRFISLLYKLPVKALQKIAHV